MAKRGRKAPGRNGPVRRLPWGGDAWAGDWSDPKRDLSRGNFRRSSRWTPRPGGRNGPVRSAKR